MNIAREHGKWRKDHNRWLSAKKKWRKDQIKATHALKDLDKLLKRYDYEVRAFEKKANSHKRVMNGRHNLSLHKKLKKAHSKQSTNFALQAKAHRRIIKMTKEIESTIRRYH